MNGLWVISTAVLAALGAADAKITASLEVAAAGDESLFPYSTARLSLTNSAAAAVETVVLRPAGGGPAVRARFAAPPGGRKVRLLPPLKSIRTRTQPSCPAAFCGDHSNAPTSGAEPT